MGSIAAILSNVLSKVGTSISGSEQAISSLTDDLETIPADTTKYQVRAFVTGDSPQSDSNTTYLQMEITIDLNHRLGPITTESFYTFFLAPNDYMTLLDDTWWETIPGIIGVDETPVMSDMTRIGNVISYEITITVAVDVT